jgi:hypothetical protein
LALPFFAVTLFVSAFLLFLVQPMIGKMILPALGGTPQVWNTCMVFFQMALLAGYAYTHTISSKLKLRQQLVVHCIMLAVPFIILMPGGPFNITGFVPPPGANPIGYTLWFLLRIVGLPFFVVATSAPLLQKWFASTGHPAAKDPYFLYAASNVGSLLALLAYPIFIEPYVRLRGIDPQTHEMVFFSQPWVWTIGYVVLALLVIGCASMVWAAPPSVHVAGAGTAASGAGAAVQEPAVKEQVAAETAIKTPAAVGGGARSTAIKKGSKQKKPLPPLTRREPTPPPAALDEAKRLEAVTPWRRVRWVLLAAVPSSLMLGITTYITTDLSPIPLFWLIPLTLYLLSFILVFSRWPVVWTGQPHTVMVLAQPVVLALLIVGLALLGDIQEVRLRVFLCVLAFFVTTMVCHGELAKDRPGTKHLTEFYLWMSVGGMLGGMFNGLVAPLIFTGVWEFPLALFAACLVRPVLKDGGWADTWFATNFAKPVPGAPAPKPGPGRHVRKGHPEETPQLHRTLDIVLPLGVLILVAVLGLGLRSTLATMFNNAGAALVVALGVPLAIACFYYARPLRFGLAIGAVLVVQGLMESRGEAIWYSDRSYFGILRVLQDANDLGAYTSLRHGTTLHGQNFRRPDEKKFWGDPAKDWSRYANTYYHRFGPAGVVMEKFNWFPGPQNTYWADFRMPTSIVGLGGDALSQLVNVWSEPPYAVIGLGTGTMASYARYGQHCHYYEIDNHIRRLSESVMYKDGRPCFTYVQDAKDPKERGASVWILMGDARLKMADPYLTFEEAREKLKIDPAALTGNSPEAEKLRTKVREETGGPEHFYHMMVVDAFSSDAIPIHLLTKEAVEMYFKHLDERGILCVHTSNRHIDLVPVVADIATSLGYAYKRGHDEVSKEYQDRRSRIRDPRDDGHSSSEWVMVARKPEYLAHLEAPPGYDEGTLGQYWTTPGTQGRFIWTDDYSNVLSCIRELQGQSRRR